MNEGQFAKEMRKYGYSRKIISFEPLSFARKKLLTFALADPSSEVHGQSAIGDQDGEIAIHIAGNSDPSSELTRLESHSIAAGGSDYIDSQRIPIARLDSAAYPCLTPESNMFIKIDTQGFDWQVLDGCT